MCYNIRKFVTHINKNIHIYDDHSYDMIIYLQSYEYEIRKSRNNQMTIYMRNKKRPTYTIGNTITKYTNTYYCELVDDKLIKQNYRMRITITDRGINRTTYNILPKNIFIAM